MKALKAVALILVIVTCIAFLTDKWGDHYWRSQIGARSSLVRVEAYNVTHTDLEIMRSEFRKRVQAPFVANVVGEVEVYEQDQTIELCGTVNSPDLKRDVPFRGYLYRLKSGADLFTISQFAPDDSAKEAEIAATCEGLRRAD